MFIPLRGIAFSCSKMSFVWISSAKRHICWTAWPDRYLFIYLYSTWSPKLIIIFKKCNHHLVFWTRFCYKILSGWVTLCLITYIAVLSNILFCTNKSGLSKERITWFYFWRVISFVSNSPVPSKLTNMENI